MPEQYSQDINHYHSRFLRIILQWLDSVFRIKYNVLIKRINLYSGCAFSPLIRGTCHECRSNRPFSFLRCLCGPLHSPTDTHPLCSKYTHPSHPFRVFPPSVAMLAFVTWWVRIPVDLSLSTAVHTVYLSHMGLPTMPRARSSHAMGWKIHLLTFPSIHVFTCKVFTGQDF